MERRHFPPPSDLQPSCRCGRIKTFQRVALELRVVFHCGHRFKRSLMWMDFFVRKVSLLRPSKMNAFFERFFRGGREIKGGYIPNRSDPINVGQLKNDINYKGRSVARGRGSVRRRSFGGTTRNWSTLVHQNFLSEMETFMDFSESRFSELSH